MNNANRQTWIDALRLCAGVSMIGLHSTSDPNGLPFPDYEMSERIAPMIVRAFVYTARTELFIIIALFLLLASLENRPRGYVRTIGSYARKLLLPFAFWTVFFAGYNFVKATSFGYSESLLNSYSDPLVWLRFLALGDVKYHMHFIPTLFLIILTYPFFRMATRFPWLGLLVFVGLAVKQQVDAALWSNLYDSELLPFLIRLSKTISYVGYGLVAGSLLHIWKNTNAIALSRLTPMLLWCGGILFFIKLIATWKTISTGSWPYGYAPGFWADFLMPVMLFAIFMSLSNKNWPSIFTRIAPYSFGLYLCHPIFLDLIEIGLRGIVVAPIVQTVTKFSLALICTSVLVHWLSKSNTFAWTIGLGKFPLSGFSQRKIRNEGIS